MCPERLASSRRRRNTRLTILAGGLVGWLLFAPDDAVAQRIGGAVTDATGAVLPGVTVEAPAVLS